MHHRPLLMRPGHDVRLADLDPGATPGFDGKADVREKLPPILRNWPSCRTSSPQRNHARCWWCCRNGHGGKDARSSTSCPASIRKVSTCSASSRRPTRKTHTISSGAVRRCCRTRPIVIFNRSYYEEVTVVRCIPNCWRASPLPRVLTSGRTFRRHQCLRASPCAQRYGRAQVLSPHLQARTA